MIELNKLLDEVKNNLEESSKQVHSMIDHSKPWLKANLEEATRAVNDRPPWMRQEFLEKSPKWFPIGFEEIRGIPINSHPGAFGCARRHNFHEGVDLYGRPGQWVYAIRPGVVVKNMPFTGPSTGFDWWLETDALMIKDDEGYYVYGELTSPLKEGYEVSPGDKIGELVPVLPASKIRLDIPEHSVTMLHLERYDLSYDPSMGWASWDAWANRPKYLQDPTPELISILREKKRYPKFLTF